MTEGDKAKLRAGARSDQAWMEFERDLPDLQRLAFMLQAKPDRTTDEELIRRALFLLVGELYIRSANRNEG